MVSEELLEKIPNYCYYNEKGNVCIKPTVNELINEDSSKEDKQSIDMIYSILSLNQDGEYC